jgi:hypothetical protein
VEADLGRIICQGDSEVDGSTLWRCSALQMAYFMICLLAMGGSIDTMIFKGFKAEGGCR